MKLSTRHHAFDVATRVALCAMIVGSGAMAAGLAGAPVAGAASTAPLWETTGTNYGSVGGLELFDSSGNPVTGGNLTDAPIAAYVEGSSTVRSGDTKATLYAATPVNGQAPGNWGGEPLSASTTFPNASAPAPLNASTLPVVTGSSGDEDLSQYIADFPHPEGDAYANLYQLRLKTSASGQPGNTTYDSADILVSGTTWSLVYPTTNTTTSLTTTPASPVASGTSVQLTATLTPDDATGTVQFYTGTSEIGSAVTVSSGTASTTTNTLPAGTDELYAVYTPDSTSGGNGYSASSGNTSIVVQTATTTALTSTPASSANFGDSVQLNASITPAGATGSVQFEYGSTDIGTPVTVSGGSASTTTATIPAGDQTLSAVFTGTGAYGDSTGTEPFTVNGTPTTTALTSTPASSANFGDSVQLNASITPAGATGSVQFEYGSTDIGTPVTVSGGTASTTTSTIPVGDQTLSAVFIATGNYAGSTGTESFTVNGTPTTTVLTTDPADQATSGDSVQLNAAITPAEATGTVQFEYGSTDIGTPVAVTDGAASTTTSSLPVGDLTLNAVFTGTGDYAGSTGSTPFTVIGTPTTTTLTTTPADSATYGISVELNATVTPAGATGSVQFEYGSTDVGSPVTVTDGAASTTSSSLPVGEQNLSAVFTPTGGNGYAGSTGTASFDVEPITTTTTLTTNPASTAISGTPVTLTATVTPAEATGTVQFLDGSTDVGGPVPVVDGTASTTASLLPDGSLTLNADFTGSGNYGSSSNSESFTIEPLTATSTTLETSPSSPVFVGTTVIITASIASSDATGTVQFRNGSTDLGSPVDVADGTASKTTSSLPVGSNDLSAVFTPTAGNGFAGSTGTATLVVKALTTTTTNVSGSPAGPQKLGTAVTYTATVTPSEAAGSVQFKIGSTDLGSPVAVSGGTASTTTTLPAGQSTITAVFTPESGSGYSASSGSTTYDITGHTGTGYWMVASDGGVFSYGNAHFHGSTGGQHLNAPIVGMAVTPDDGGYWLVASDGGVFAYGDAQFYGSTGGLHLNAPIVGLAATPDGGGYWLVASDGGVFAYGDAVFHGSTGSLTLNKPIVAITATPDGGGYWLVASDGGVFAFGDAHFHGSTGGQQLNEPIVGIATTADGGGYWLVASDGGVFAYGDAVFHGSTGNAHLNAPIVAVTATPDGGGYWLVASDGGVFAYGDAVFHGSTGSGGLNAPVVGVAGA